MRKIIHLFFLLFLISSNAQSLQLSDFERLYKLETIQEKCDLLYGEGFSKENNIKNPNVILSKKKFIKQKQAFDEEIITISKDTITYSLSNPKAYIKFKTKIATLYRSDKNPEDNLNGIFYKKRSYRIKITESDEKREGNYSPVKFFNFIQFQVLKEE